MIAPSGAKLSSEEYPVGHFGLTPVTRIDRPGSEQMIEIFGRCGLLSRVVKVNPVPDIRAICLLAPSYAMTISE